MSEWLRWKKKIKKMEDGAQEINSLVAQLDRAPVCDIRNDTLYWLVY